MDSDVAHVFMLHMWGEGATNFVARQRTLRVEKTRGVKRVNFEKRKTPSYSALKTPLESFTLGLGTFSVLHSVTYIRTEFVQGPHNHARHESDNVPIPHKRKVNLL